MCFMITGSKVNLTSKIKQIKIQPNFNWKANENSKANLFMNIKLL